VTAVIATTAAIAMDMKYGPNSRLLRRNGSTLRCTNM
jgi:hypothetical protein